MSLLFVQFDSPIQNGMPQATQVYRLGYRVDDYKDIDKLEDLLFNTIKSFLLINPAACIIPITLELGVCYEHKD